MKVKNIFSLSRYLCSLILIFIFICSFPIYKQFAITSLAYKAEAVTIECLVENHRQIIKLENDKFFNYVNAWSASGFSSSFSSMCSEPAFNITFHFSLIDITAHDVCLKCTNYPTALGYMGFYPNPSLNIMEEMHKLFPKLKINELETYRAL